jgi:hypothetical protein
VTPQEELDLAMQAVAKATAELNAARAEKAAAEAGEPIRPARAKVQKPKRRERRPVHRSEVRAGCSGTGERFTGAEKRRIDMQPIVMKDVSPFDRPNDYKYEGVECLLVFDVKAGFMESDSWKRCKCIACAEIRRG